uniref:Uncharacterized protein n=1 Tax=Ficedula albicollis TaxID=59894 RepID=A0A803VTS8_FICAL
MLLAVEARRDERAELHQVPVTRCWGDLCWPPGILGVWAGCGSRRLRGIQSCPREMSPVLLCAPSVPQGWPCPGSGPPRQGLCSAPVVHAGLKAHFPV